jgi:hypothetical protein
LTAIPYANASLKLNPFNPSGWNLLAIMLFLREDFEQAKRVCSMGIKECGKDIKFTDSMQKKINYLDLHMTKLDIETCLYGPRDSMETLYDIFALQKKLFGSPDPQKDKNKTEPPKGK